MSPTISSPTIFFAFSIILTSISHVRCDHSIIQTACSATAPIDHNVCLRVLESTPQVASANGLRNISIAIIESGISNSTNTRAHIDAARAGLKGAYEDCAQAYDRVVENFSSALEGVEAYDYNYPSYLLLTGSTDYIRFCDSALSKQNVRDEVVSRGNQAVPIFGMSAFSIVNQLYDQIPVAPPPAPTA